MITHPDFEARTFKNDLGDQLLSLKINFYKLSLLNAITEIYFFSAILKLEHGFRQHTFRQTIPMVEQLANIKHSNQTKQKFVFFERLSDKTKICIF